MAKLDTTNIPLDLLIDYVEGLLDSEATARLEQRLAEDEYHRNIVEGIQHFYTQKGQDRAALEAYLDDFQHRLSPKAATQVRRLPRSFIAIAATLALIVTAFFLVRNSQGASSDALLAQALSTPYPSVYDQNKSGDPQDIRASIGALYQAGDYEAVIETAQALIDQSNTANPLDYFMLGLANLYQDVPNYAAAITALNQTKAFNTGSNITQQTDWYLALSYLSAGEVENARRLLEGISADGGHYKQAEASLLLKTT